MYEYIPLLGYIGTAEVLGVFENAITLIEFTFEIKQIAY